MERPLSPMQLECVRRAASSDKEIGRVLGISPDTVSNHIREAMRRLGASDRRDAMARLAVHPLYAEVDIPGVVVVAPPVSATSAQSPPSLPRRPRLFGRVLPELPEASGRLRWVVLSFLALTGAVLFGIALLNALADLGNRLAPAGAI
ncbi:helix-turn-helix transcriptional regulator [Brevundimonas sp.]|uniref:helix-turn-helix domain-containing protein n=1 Tax=Brevundimonas sp. TaxID=1871086 RepID=UPI00286A04C9|nr:helix-turn-helix transcriptional regulator [Brevundimonas sp.]